jgi:hypothetical protein
MRMVTSAMRTGTHPASVAALRLAARTEGLLLDPTTRRRRLQVSSITSGRDESAPRARAVSAHRRRSGVVPFQERSTRRSDQRPSMTIACRELPGAYRA